MLRVKLSPHDAGYPARLYRLDHPPALTATGPLEAERVIGVVGSRVPSPDSRELAHTLAYQLARAGVVVASGGAVGIDETAHDAALLAGGSTWLVAPHGWGARITKKNQRILDRVTNAASAGSRVIWPFDDGTPVDERTPRRRNGVLVGLVECVIVIQAKARSGSRNAATWGRHLGTPVFVVPGHPEDFDFRGSLLELERGARPVWSVPALFATLGFPPPDASDRRARLGGSLPHTKAQPLRRHERVQNYSDPPRFPVERRLWTEEENAVYSCLSMAPTQQDSIIERTGLPTGVTLTALLTLSLKDVVVEGPDGFFRRRFSL
jgi:DNA processing protein